MMKSKIYLLREWDCKWMYHTIKGFTYSEEVAKEWKFHDGQEEYRDYEEIEEITVG